MLGAISHDYSDPVGHLPRIDTDTFIRPPTRRDLVRRIDAAREKCIKRARESSTAFMEYCFIDERTSSGFRQQWFHDEWHEAWDEHDRVAILAPRDHAKTSNVIGRVIWELGKNTSLRVKVVCQSDGKAKERLFEITQHILFNPFVHDVFPELMPDPDAEWSAHKIYLQRTARHRDASVEALGILSSASGGRADLLVADDVVDRRNALSLPGMRKQVKQAWKSDWTNLVEPDGRIWYICTPWHPDDLSHEIMANSAYLVLKYEIDQRFGAIWPEKWSEKSLRERYVEIGSVEFNRAFRNQAIDLDASLIHPDWFQYSDLSTDENFNQALAADELVFLPSYDPAGTPTGNKDQDYTGRCIGAIDTKRGVVYIVDAGHARVSVAKSAETVYEEACRYRPWMILIEKTGQSTLDEWVVNEHPELDGLIKVTKPKVSKAQRLLGSTPLMEKGKVIFSHHLNPDDGAFQAGLGSIVDELQEFPFGKHDDIVDAFSQLCWYARLHFLDVDAIEKENVLESGADDEERYRF